MKPGGRETLHDQPFDPLPWAELRHHLSEAARLLAGLRKEHFDKLDFKHYSKLQVAETTVEKFVVDIEEVYQAVAGRPLA